MPTVRRRYHYGCILLDPNVVGKTKALCGNTVNIIHSNGAKSALPLGGFRHIVADSICIKHISICDIDAFTSDDPIFGNWIYYGPNALLRGTVIRKSVYIDLIDDLPITYCHIGSNAAPAKKQSNVHRLAPHIKKPN